MLPVMTNYLFEQVTPAEVEAEDKKELVAEMDVDEEQWPPPDTSMHANSGPFLSIRKPHPETHSKTTHICRATFRNTFRNYSHMQKQKPT